MDKDSNTKTLNAYLDELSDEINKLYGYVNIADDNFDERRQLILVHAVHLPMLFSSYGT